DRMTVGHTLQAFEQHLRRRRIDELREEDHQRPPLQSEIELGQAKGEIGLLGLIGELARSVVQPGEVGHPPRRLDELPYRRVESETPHEIAAAQRYPAEQQSGVNRVVEPWHAFNRLRHQMPGVEGQHDLMVALRSELLRQEFQMPGGALPIDEAVVETARMLAQRIELGAFPLLLLDLDPIDRVPAEELNGGGR